MPLKEEPQAGLFDRTIENPELEELLEKRIEHREAAAEYAKACKSIRDIFAQVSPPLSEGERVRCGGYVWTNKLRNGGGFEMPEWESVGISDLQVI